MSARAKGKVYKTVVKARHDTRLRSGISQTMSREAELEVAELKMLRRSMRMARLGKVRAEYLKETENGLLTR